MDTFDTSSYGRPQSLIALSHNAHDTKQCHVWLQKSIFNQPSLHRQSLSHTMPQRLTVRANNSRWNLNRPSIQGRDSILGKGRIFSLCHHVQQTLGLTQPHIQWVPGALSLRVKRPGREYGHSPPP